MSNKEEKARRNDLVHALRDKQTQKVRESFPVPFTALKELFDFLDERLSDADCDDTLRFTREFMQQNGMDECSVISWLEDNRGHCDCEVLANVEEVVADAVPRYDQIRKYMDSLGGMTVNERLYACGLIGEWDAAIKRRDLEAMTNLLRRVELTEADAIAIADTMLKRHLF
jgi:Protein of unknown function (DUF2695)